MPKDPLLFERSNDNSPKRLSTRDHDLIAGVDPDFDAGELWTAHLIGVLAFAPWSLSQEDAARIMHAAANDPHRLNAAE
ncbi:MAG: hypothetical protein MUE84_08625 [Hyphomonas sp.]|nr:hypothetical protein [Hyphomonas sp.]